MIRFIKKYDEVSVSYRIIQGTSIIKVNEVAELTDRRLTIWSVTYHGLSTRTDIVN